jgi:flagellar basal body-associated protein FliL
MDKKTANILFVVLIVAVILFMIFLVFWLMSNSKDCLAQPMRYFETKTNSQCFCTKNPLQQGFDTIPERFNDYS